MLRAETRIRLAGVFVFMLCFAVPSAAFDAPRHVIYLHGRIIQDQQNARPVHPEHGAYEWQAIVDALRARGLTVSASIRPPAITVDAAADGVVAQIRELLASGVASDHITVMGASMGSSIAWLAAARLQNPDVRFVLLGPCASTGFAAASAAEGKAPAGRILVIREESDVPSGDCAAPTGDGPGKPALRELVIETGLRHGFLYRPLPEWLNPATDWARAER